MKNTYQVRLEVADGFVWVTVFEFNDDEWVEWLSEKFDHMTKQEMSDLTELAANGDRDGVYQLYCEISRVKHRRPA
jgi:hypothetical protein